MVEVTLDNKPWSLMCLKILTWFNACLVMLYFYFYFKTIFHLIWKLHCFVLPLICPQTICLEFNNIMCQSLFIYLLQDFSLLKNRLNFLLKINSSKLLFCNDDSESIVIVWIVLGLYTFYEKIVPVFLTGIIHISFSFGGIIV